MAVAVLDPADAELVRGHLSGQREALDVLYRRYFPRLVRMCRRRIGDQAAAEDVAQDALLRALDHLDAFDATRPMWPWLKAIALNLMVDRARERSRETPLDEDEPSLDGAANPEERVLLLGERPLLAAALGRLPSRQRTAVALRYLEEWDPAEAAEFLGLSPSAFAQLLFRARRRLRMEYRRLSTGALGLVFVPVRWFRRTRDHVAIRMRGVWFISSPAEIAASGAASQIVAGVLAVMVTLGSGVSAPGAKDHAIPGKVKLAAAAPHRHHAHKATGDAQKPPSAPTAGATASAPAHTSGGPAASTHVPGPVQDVTDPNHGVSRPEDARLTSIVPAPGTNGKTIFAAGMAKCAAASCPSVLFRSTDGGATWSRLKAAEFRGSQLLFPPSADDHRIFAMGDTGLQVSEDLGESFELAATVGSAIGMGSAAISPAFNDGDPSVLIGSQTLMKYDDGSGAIEPLPYALTAPLQPAYATAYPGDPRILVGATTLDPVTGTWSASVSTCVDATCSATPLGQSSQAPKIRLAPDFSASGVGFAFVSDRLFRTADGAQSFAPVVRFWKGGWISDVAVSGDLVLAGVWSEASEEGGGLYLSRDGANSWEAVANSLFSDGVVTVTVDSGRILVGLVGGGIACSTDGGLSWDLRC